MLAYGNYLNGNTARGGAFAFKLDALLKLLDVASAIDQVFLPPASSALLIAMLLYHAFIIYFLYKSSVSMLPPLANFPSRVYGTFNLIMLISTISISTT